MPLTHGSLSTGICGFDIGAQANGIETLWCSEIEPLRRDIIQWLLPNTRLYGNLKKIKNPKPVDIISFGFPCQDISAANPHGKGLEGSKSSLWHAGFKIICQCRPRYVIIENSPMLLHKGLRTLLGQFAQAGYNAEWHIIPCQAFGLPHKRERLFILAYAIEKQRDKTNLVFSGDFSQNVCKKTSIRLEPGLRLQNSWESWAETIRSFHHLDDGIPPNILYGLLEAAGDTVSPRITSWLFAKIKEAEQKKYSAKTSP